jgi:hypothetical protein
LDKIIEEIMIKEVAYGGKCAKFLKNTLPR